MSKRTLAVVESVKTKLPPPFETGRQKAQQEIANRWPVLNEIHNQVNTFADWEKKCKNKGYLIEPDGSGKLIAHIDGDEKGVWDPKYGGSGMGWFF